MVLELTLNRGKTMMDGVLVGVDQGEQFDTFEDLLAAFEQQLSYICGRAMLSTHIHESHLPKLHSAPILSATYRSALEKGADLYSHYGAKYNSSSLNAIGLGTVVDSLAAIRKLVYEDGTMTLAELTDILRNNWKDHEALRLRIKNKFPKYGVGNPEVDALARRIVATLARIVSKKPNTKGGFWRLGTFSINWRWEFGEKTAASADGRHAGDPLSQNTGATFGADREGATAHLLSAAAIDMSHTPNGSIIDIDLHESAVRGENGLRALTASLLTYFDLGGFAVHYNVLDTETLKKAKKSPADYPNLQVRLCGWNVLFSSLSDKEKDEFIARSEHEGGGV
jgi:formate C-acetyltransferase